MSVEVEDGTSGICTNNQKVELEFIKKYEQLEELWDPKNPDYTNKYKRNVALDILLKILQKINPSAMRVHVRRKINCLRSCYRKELRRHLLSRKPGPNGEEIYDYIPTSWKFSVMRFVDRIEKPHYNAYKDMVKVNIDEFDNTYEDNNYLDSEGDQSTEEIEEHFEETPINIPVVPGKRKRSMKIIQDGNVSTFVGVVKAESDIDHNISDKEYEAVGANVACKLKRMNPQQRYQAELLINKVLIKGLKNALNDETDLTDTWTI